MQVKFKTKLKLTFIWNEQMMNNYKWQLVLVHEAAPSAYVRTKVQVTTGWLRNGQSRGGTQSSIKSRFVCQQDSRWAGGCTGGHLIFPLLLSFQVDFILNVILNSMLYWILGNFFSYLKRFFGSADLVIKIAQSFKEKYILTGFLKYNLLITACLLQI